MDYALDLIATLSRWSRSHLSDISLAIMATLLVLFGPAINAWVQQRIGSLNFVFRTLLFVLICAVGYGLAMVFVTPWLAKGLSYFNNYTLAPVLLLVFFVIGMIADRS
ncbi:DUF3392 domain-containing protein [Pseudomonas aeruginosa]|uniref:DUF3392 domain-containing protein n=1 Tax=Pseudomonas aeruginosa group TaxID=136841 RepID=UPI00053D5347|nr:MULTISPECIES: DUF3392 domain-containing protein [Pseudomonas aeruginosa group]MCO2253139.1 DUF3392 domain-containing protein [Pseudomonas aeruginosa]MCO2260137.1 DUF3392 domain-containing protein [Pseudomonas aeruginosa]MCO3078422.1 DUF3392 domain-containing protein [Pseudomonas aeruginosa]MDK2347818.1 DUF3392 domain-containing protein [Pseudomonas paraeruginosa]MEA8482146.1 DUF3392 domain-containing protein [Pseudomonas aeruginosa]